MKHKNFFMVSNRIFDLELKPKEFSVYCCLLKHCNEKMQCFPSRNTIAKMCCIDKKTVDSALTNLCNRGLIQKIHRKRADGSKSSNMYHVTSIIDTDSG